MIFTGFPMTDDFMETVKIVQRKVFIKIYIT